jgi:hypothetical protein
VCKLTNVATGSTLSTGGVFISAEESLREPEPQALLSHSSRSLEEKTRWQRPGTDAFTETLAQQLVSVEVYNWHFEIWPLPRRWSGILISSGDGTISDLNLAAEPDVNRYRSLSCPTS